ncbi:MAG: EcsC family protein [Candidatus Coproplasma sp.]
MDKIKFGRAKASNTINSEDTEKKPIITQEDIAKMLDACYKKCLNGIPNVSESVEELAADYLNKYKTKETACKAMITNQIIKCTTSGFLTGFGGFITLPVTLPANVTSVLYVQMRMISCIAYMAGMELNSDSTQTFVYACLAGVTVNEIVKQVGIKFGIKFATSMVKKIPGKVLTKINQKVGFRFLTKFGSKGLINIGKCVPFVGAVVGGSFDLVETKVIADRAYHWFMEEDFSATKEKDTETEEDNIIITAEDFEDTENSD